MAVKIYPDLPAYTSPATTDVLPIVDVGADTTKRVSLATLLKNASAGTATAPGIAFNGDSNTGFYQPSADQVGVATAGVSRITVDESGNAVIQGTSNANDYKRIDGANSILRSNRDGTSSANHFTFFNDNGLVGSISTSGSATAYNVSSDYRLKENVVPLTDAIDRVNQLQVYRFNFIADPNKTVDGFIAHEAQEVVPESVTGIKDEVDDNGDPVYQGIDQSKMVPLLTAALQEALTKIESLEDRLAALEAKL